MMAFEMMIERILEAKANGFDEAVFVGLEQIDTIRRHAFETGFPKGEPDVDNTWRFKIEGLPIYVVDATHYFKVT